MSEVAPEVSNEYLYLMRPVRPGMVIIGPTPEEATIIEEHNAYLERLAAQGQVILYGRTQNPDESSFGIVIFRAACIAEANGIMENDPFVRHRLVTATLYPYRVAYIREV